MGVTPEGFSKKLLVKIGLYNEEYFNSKSANFSKLNDPSQPDRKSVCSKEKYVDTYLRKLSLSIDTNRNFFMHSDGSTVTKVEDVEEAIKKVNSIHDEIKDYYAYFGNIFSL